MEKQWPARPHGGTATQWTGLVGSTDWVGFPIIQVWDRQ